MKKMKSEADFNEKSLTTKLNVKEKTIDDLLEDKKKMTVELKILKERLVFAKIME
jgi:plasmid maintenance system antidote protein VapI